MPYCKKCNETLVGDGYTSVLHCPYSDDEDTMYAEPDAVPIYCNFEEESDNND